MPARKIPRNYRSVTGIFPSIFKNGRGIAYESPLERDFFTLLEFDDDVKTYEEQPVKILHKKGRKTIPYYPDCLITYRPEIKRRDLLVDVKDMATIEETREDFEYRRNVVAHYAEERGQDYTYFTEKDIRGVYLENVKFLYHFAHTPQNLDEVQMMIKGINVAGALLTVNELLAKLTPDKKRQMELLPSIWHLVCIKKISTDLDNKELNMKAILEVTNDTQRRQR
jgi:TnsA endonuclease-like protein